MELPKLVTLDLSLLHITPYALTLSNSGDNVAVFGNIPIGTQFTITGSKGGYTGLDGRNRYSGTLMGRLHVVNLEFTNRGSIAVTAKSQSLGTIISGAAVEVVGMGMQKVSTPENPAVFTLPSGQYTFKVTRRGYAPVTITDLVKAGQERSVTATMAATQVTTISGYARDKDNIPLHNQTVKLYKSLSNDEVASTITERDSPPARARGGPSVLSHRRSVAAVPGAASRYLRSRLL